MPDVPWNYGPALTAFPKALSDKETALLRQRRVKANVDKDQPPVGLALSGGGIRSATFGLGVLQALAKTDLLKRVDYLSTVSGGGYIGAFLGCMFQREEEPQSVFNKLLDRNSLPIKWLRENGRYLAPNGAGDVLVGLAVGVRNFLSVHFVMALLMMPLALLLVVMARMSLLWFAAALAALGFAGLTMLYWLVMTVPHVLCCMDRDKVDKWRRNLTTIMGYLLLFLAALLFLGVLLRLSRELLSCDLKEIHNIGLVGVIALVLGGGPKVVRKIRDMSEKVMGLGLQLAGSIVGFTVFTLYVFIWLVAAEALIPNADGNVHLACLSPCMVCCLGGFIFIACIVALLFLARSAVSVKQPEMAEAANNPGVMAFLSDSSFGPMYQARLARAYLGPSNKKRFSGKCRRSVTDPVKGDDVNMNEYRPHAFGGPLHLINVTLNETVSGESQMEHRDRKGVGLCHGPAGVSVGARHHALFSRASEDGPPENGPTPAQKAEAGVPDDSRTILHGLNTGNPEDFHVFPDRPIHCETMALGRWTAISGAAVSTGMGSYTSLGLSLLFGLFNMRLGHWWDSGIDPKDACRGRFGVWIEKCLLMALPLHTFLLYEWFGRFRGTGRRRWYLTDGGHFENSGAYELIRRRLPYIIVCDNSCDPDYQFEDMGNLVRKARMDFGATVKFLSQTEMDEYFKGYSKKGAAPFPLNPKHFGELSGLGPKGESGFTGAHALLARITYEDCGKESLMVVIKPGVTGDEPVDITNYRASHKDFPHETTGDQIFDEAQWESYRALGFHAAEAVFNS